MDPITLSGFLVWILAGGCVVMASWILEQIAWFQNLTARNKRMMQYVLSAVIGIGALLIQLYIPANVMQQLEPYFAILASVFLAVFTNQMAHLVDPGRRK